MYIDARIQISCIGEAIVAKENERGRSCNDGTTIVCIGNERVGLTLGSVTADQLDAIASGLLTIAYDMRITSDPPCESVGYLSCPIAPAIDAVAADVEEVTLGQCQHADHVLVGDSDVHWIVISAKLVGGCAWIRNTKTAELLSLPSARIVRRVK